MPAAHVLTLACSARNTTLPHPDANLSPDATISQDDVAIHKVLSRTRRSFLAKYRRTISHGFITPQMELEMEEAMYSEVAEACGEHTLVGDRDDPAASSAAASVAARAAVKDGSEGRRTSKDGGDSVSSAGDLPMLDNASTRSRRRRDFLRRLGLHK